MQPCEFSYLQFGPALRVRVPSANCELWAEGGDVLFCCVQLCTHRGLLNGHRAQGTRREAEAPRGHLGACSGCRQCRGFLRCRTEPRQTCGSDARNRARRGHTPLVRVQARESEKEGEREHRGGLQGRGASDTPHVPGKKRKSEGHNSPP